VCLKVQVKLYLCCFFNWAPRHEGVVGSGVIDPSILNLCTWWSWAVSFRPRPLYIRGKRPRYPLDRSLGGLHSRSGGGGEEKKSHPRTRWGLNPGRPHRSLVSILTYSSFTQSLQANSINASCHIRFNSFTQQLQFNNYNRQLKNSR